MNDTAKNKKGVYIVSEQACLSPHSGAGKHIEVGIKELSRQFNINLILFCRPFKDNTSSFTPAAEAKNIFSSFRKGIAWIVKWWFILIRNHVHFLSYYRLVKKVKPDFIYERAAYLNFNGLLISKLLKLPHYYEVNGLYYKDNAEYFPKVYTRIAKWLERHAYKRTYCFFVGGLNTLLRIKEGPRAEVIQNGIETSFIKSFRDVTYHIPSDERVHLAFVGHAMQHHRLDILAEALRGMQHKNKLCLHLVGSNYEAYKHLFVDMGGTEIIYHGVLTHTQLIPVLAKVDIGIVPFALDYYSNMKIFLYAAAKLIIVLPDSRNFRRIFSDEEAVFFKNEDAVELSAVLDNIAVNRNKYDNLRENAFNKVKESYTWPAVFKNIINVIDQA